MPRDPEEEKNYVVQLLAEQFMLQMDGVLVPMSKLYIIQDKIRKALRSAYEHGMADAERNKR